MDINNVLLKNANLLQFAQALIIAEGNSYKDNYINNYFTDYKTISVSLGPIYDYEHRKMQYIWKDFFENNKWELVEECSFSYNAKNPAVTFDIEYSPDQFVKGYKNACLFYKKGEEKLSISIEIFDRNSLHYTLTSTENNSSLLQELKKYSIENNLYRGKKIDCRANFLKLDDINWDDIIIPDKTKNIIKTNIEENFSLIDLFKKYDLSVKRGVILYGPPGTGKTKICKCLARETKYSVLYALPSDFANPSAISRVCEMAQDLAPCLFIIEDIDWIASDRDKGGSAFVMELMNKLDGLESFGDIITLGTTNNLGDLEKAVKNRPGRFDRIIEIGKPDTESIHNMLKAFTSKYIVEENVDLRKLAVLSDGLTGAHINDLCKTAAIYAIKKMSFKDDKLVIKKVHFDEAIKEVKNKDYSTYLEQQSKSKLGFSKKISSIEDFLNNED